MNEDQRAPACAGTQRHQERDPFVRRAVDQASHRGRRRRMQQRRERQLDAELVLDRLGQADRRKRRSADVEEVVVGPHRRDSEDALPQRDEPIDGRLGARGVDRPRAFVCLGCRGGRPYLFERVRIAQRVDVRDRRAVDRVARSAF